MRLTQDDIRVIVDRGDRADSVARVPGLHKFDPAFDCPGTGHSAVAPQLLEEVVGRRGELLHHQEMLVASRLFSLSEVG